MSRRFASVSDDAIASEIAEAHLLDGGSAIGAAAAGFFAAAGQRPGVLLSPLTMLVAGVGLGARVLDGRLRQPGLGARRPRGFVGGEPIPAAARVAAPASIAALLVALAYEDGLSLGTVLAPGIRIATAGGADGRARVLDRIVAVGGRALAEGGIARALLAVGGPPEGGILTADDLSASLEVDQDAVGIDEGAVGTARPSWDGDESTASGCVWHGLCAMDPGGFAVALCYAEAIDGVGVAELDLCLPRAAIPVQRGVTRVPPGTPLSAPAPIRISIRSGEPTEVRYAPEGAHQGSFGLRRDARTRRVETVRS